MVKGEERERGKESDKMNNGARKRQRKGEGWQSIVGKERMLDI